MNFARRASPARPGELISAPCISGPRISGRWISGLQISGLQISGPRISGRWTSGRAISGKDASSLSSASSLCRSRSGLSRARSFSSCPTNRSKGSIKAGGLRIGLKTQKSPASSAGLVSVEFIAGDHLISHTVTRAVPSAQRGLTSVFGMGTGDPSQYGHRQT